MQTDQSRQTYEAALMAAEYLKAHRPLQTSITPVEPTSCEDDEAVDVPVDKAKIALAILTSPLWITAGVLALPVAALFLMLNVGRRLAKVL